MAPADLAKKWEELFEMHSLLTFCHWHKCLHCRSTSRCGVGKPLDTFQEVQQLAAFHHRHLQTTRNKQVRKKPGKKQTDEKKKNGWNICAKQSPSSSNDENKKISKKGGAWSWWDRMPQWGKTHCGKILSWISTWLTIYDHHVNLTGRYSHILALVILSIFIDQRFPTCGSRPHQGSPDNFPGVAWDIPKMGNKL